MHVGHVCFILQAHNAFCPSQSLIPTQDCWCGPDFLMQILCCLNNALQPQIPDHQLSEEWGCILKEMSLFKVPMLCSFADSYAFPRGLLCFAPTVLRYVDPSLKLVQAHKTQWKENEKKKKPQQRFFWGNGNETEQLSSCRSDRNRIKTWKICQLCGGEMQVCVF